MVSRWLSGLLIYFSYLLLSYNMIDYSPTTKYTAQKIQDRVSRGAYLYATITVKADEQRENIEKIYKKFTEIYKLNLSSRQRNYYLEKGKPIASLIVQEQFQSGFWRFIILFTTPRSHLHSKQYADLIPSPTEKIDANTPTNLIEWTKDDIEKDVETVKKYFNQNEDIKSVLTKPYLCLDFSKDTTLELVRMTNKKYGKHPIKNYRIPNKSFSWTWRFNKSCFESKKLALCSIINREISQKGNFKAIQDLSNWQRDIEKFAIYKGTRHQAGRLHAFGKMFYKRKSNNCWNDSLGELNLKVVARYSTYADSLEEYITRRDLYHLFNVEIPRELIVLGSFEGVMNEDILNYVSRQRSQNKKLSRG